MKTHYQIIDGTRIAIHQSDGHGAPLVLVHGNSASSRAFTRQLEGPLGETFKVYAIDLPGHGQSDNAHDPVVMYSLPGFAALLVKVSQHLALQRAVYAGWSLGGHIVLEAAAHLPEAAGFCVFGTPPLAWPPAMDQAFLPDPSAAILFQQDYTDDEIRIRAEGMLKPGAPVPSFLLDDIRRSDGAFRAGLLASLGTVGLTDEVRIVAGLRQPLAVLHGGLDRVVNGEYIDALPMPSLWRGSVQHLPDAGHMPQWEDSEDFDRLLNAFMQDTSATSAASR